MVETAVQLYRHLLRRCRELPEGVRDYYRHYIRQQFNSHSDETDPQRVKDIIRQSLKDAQWLVEK
ncbi:UPF0631 protein-like protein, partial [Dinothrombium tinctorium]